MTCRGKEVFGRASWGLFSERPWVCLVLSVFIFILACFNPICSQLNQKKTDLTARITTNSNGNLREMDLTTCATTNANGKPERKREKMDI